MEAFKDEGAVESDGSNESDKSTITKAFFVR